MKALQKSILAIALVGAATVGANAAVTYGASTVGQPYVGLKVGQFDADIAGADKATAYGVYGGYQFDQNFGAEMEYIGSDDADINNSNGTRSTYDAKTYGAYGTYNYNFVNTPIYAKAKLGVAKNEIKINQGNKADKTSIAGGLGLGYNVTPAFAVEADYNWLPSAEIGNTKYDTNLWTVGAKLKF